MDTKSIFDDELCNDFEDYKFNDIVYDNKTIISKNFENCLFKGCNFSDTKFKSCKFKYCTFINCNLSLINVSNCYFVNVLFEECKIIGINWINCKWHQVKLDFPLKFIKSNLSHSNFLGLDLSSILITESIVREVDFRDCNLSRATLSSNDFENSLFGNTNLIKADFTNSTNYSISIIENKIKGAKFSMPEAINLLYNLGIEIN